MRPSWKPVVGRLMSALALCLAACSSPGSMPIVGPDGSPMAHVHCGSEQGVCFRIAGELCPSGYEMKPVLSGNDGNFLVRCRVATPPVVAVQSPAPPAPGATPTSAHAAKETWPSASELLNPWPRPEANATAQPALTAPAKSASPQSDVDIGY